MAADALLALELPVDAAVPLLHAAGVPGDVEVEEVGAVVLEVDALAGRVGRDEDAERVVGRLGVERGLQLFARLVAEAAVEDGDALLDADVGGALAVDGGEGRAELLGEVAHGVGELGEDEEAAAVPGRRRGRAGRGGGNGVEEVRADPLDEELGARAGSVAGFLGDGGHLVEEGALLG